MKSRLSSVILNPAGPAYQYVPGQGEPSSMPSKVSAIAQGPLCAITGVWGIGRFGSAQQIAMERQQNAARSGRREGGRGDDMRCRGLKKCRRR